MHTYFGFPDQKSADQKMRMRNGVYIKVGLKTYHALFVRLLQQLHAKKKKRIEQKKKNFLSFLSFNLT
jgi:hypothetical protein